MPFKIEHDDDQMSTMDKVQKELAKIGIPVEFQDDGIEHDGYMLFNIKADHRGLETAIAQIESRYPGVPGTVLSRVLTEDGPAWTVGFGALQQPKEFFTGETIAEALFKAEEGSRVKKSKG